MKTNRDTPVVIGTSWAACVGILAVGIFIGLRLTAARTPFDTSALFPSTVPWSGIGGCGVGGGATGGGSGGAQWIGKGAPGGLLDCEVRIATSSVHASGGGIGILRTFSIPLSLNYHPGPVDLTATIPFTWKSKPQKLDQTSGIGDMALLVSRRFGPSGQIRLDGGLMLPSGKADIHDRNHLLLPSDLQNGSGIFKGIANIDFTIDRDWGICIAGLAYSPGLFFLKSGDKEWDEELLRGIADSKKFAGARTGSFTSSNDAGVEFPDYIDVHAYLGAKDEHLTHSFGARCAIPLADGSFQIREHIVTVDDHYAKSAYPASAAILSNLSQIADTIEGSLKFRYPVNDTVAYEAISADSVWVVDRLTKNRNKHWISLALIYGMEIPFQQTPFFWALSVPVEFNKEAGVGVSGFAIEAGVKFIAY